MMVSQHTLHNHATWCLAYAVAVLAVLSSTSAARSRPSAAPSNIAIAELMSEDPMAKSLDGTPAYYYIRRAKPGSVNASKFVIHIQGGGWCSSTQSCKSRAGTNLGSSDPEKTKENSVQGGQQDLNTVHGCQNNRWCGALMVNDPAMNPYAHDWNAVLLRYTDGASWIGNQPEPTADGLYFRGAYSLRAIMRSLSAKYNLASATEGGLATFMHIDTFADHIHATAPHAKILGMPDSGFWPDDPAEGFSNTFNSMYKMQNNGSSYWGMVKNCKWKTSNVSKCLFPQYFADEIETPLFPLQSIYDPLQKGKDPQSHGQWLLAQINQTVLLNKPQNGAWVHSCERHCGAELITIDGDTVPHSAIGQLMAGTRRLWLQEAKYPCTQCCNDVKM